ncbi:hypothetical protein BS50DRAFT_229490 [Corynespora cassiicola Philippines]|uniref:Uncharacterized protein n=1 Tax=Corynespora cassiicola Philippines TaxID=1448308 RepID=A0A2T2N275_CORCC|nr:hypothetical protein BS50DRAFT_229490 [Corynespora cassiicola Philippines]
MVKMDALLRSTKRAEEKEGARGGKAEVNGKKDNSARGRRRSEYISRADAVQSTYLWPPSGRCFGGSRGCNAKGSVQSPSRAIQGGEAMAAQRRPRHGGRRPAAVVGRRENDRTSIANRPWLRCAVLGSRARRGSRGEMQDGRGAMRLGLRGRSAEPTLF